MTNDQGNLIMLNLDKVISFYPKQLGLEISSQAQTQAWQKVQDYSNKVARWNAYVNYLCLQTLVDWLQAKPNLQEEVPLVSPNLKALPSIWEMVNGCAVELGKTRLVLIPSETSDTENFTVPFEWVDIPGWAADYYLAVQMHLEDNECWLRVWGFTTHRLLKEGKKDYLRRTYSLAGKDLIESLNVMWVSRKLCPEEEPVVEPLPNLSVQQAEGLLARLGKPTLYSPRLEVPFAQWGALLANKEWREMLHQRRLGKVPQSKGPIPLHSWLQNFLEVGWHTVEEMGERLTTPALNLAYGAGGNGFRDDSSIIPQAVPTLIELLQSSSSKQTSLPALKLLGQVGHGNLNAIAFLSQLLENTEDIELRRQAALSLGQIAASHPQAGMRRVKLIDLGVQLENKQVALVVTMTPQGEKGTNVHLRVYAAGEQTYLPPNLQLIVLNEKGETFLEVQSRSADNWMQLELNGEGEDSFIVKLVLGGASFSKEFVL
ncbi:MAG: DUF1822 family protein [Symploca sp. SIO3E6]|nr:DUF1822 family protein [Caldora sp. SIO3E6]